MRLMMEKRGLSWGRFNVSPTYANVGAIPSRFSPVRYFFGLPRNSVRISARVASIDRTSPKAAIPAQTRSSKGDMYPGPHVVDDELMPGGLPVHFVYIDANDRRRLQIACPFSAPGF